MGYSRAVVEDGGKVSVNWLVSHGKFQTGGLKQQRHGSQLWRLIPKARMLSRLGSNEGVLGLFVCVFSLFLVLVHLCFCFVWGL